MLIDVIIQMFEWSWDSIAAECTNFIGPAGMFSSICSDDHVINLFLGYGFIQASPAQETITGQSTILAYKSILSDIFIEKVTNGGRTTSRFPIYSQENGEIAVNTRIWSILVMRPVSKLLRVSPYWGLLKDTAANFVLWYKDTIFNHMTGEDSG